MLFNHLGAGGQRRWDGEAERLSAEIVFQTRTFSVWWGSNDSAPITLQPDLALARWWASPYLGSKGAIPRERDRAQGRQRGCSPPPRLADTGGAVWEFGERREAGAP